MSHLSSSYLCPDCEFVCGNAMQCEKCANRCGLLNLSSVLNRPKPLMAETQIILKLMKQFGRERICAPK